VQQPIEPISFCAERGYDMFFGYRVQSESTLANELYDKSFVVAAQHPEWQYSQVQSLAARCTRRISLYE
jgi:hypothetical protein